MLRKVYAHVRDNAVADAINCLSREVGWKPTTKTMKLLRPTRMEKRCRFENVQTVKTQAERIIAESEADDGWLRLIGEEQ